MKNIKHLTAITLLTIITGCSSTPNQVNINSLVDVNFSGYEGFSTVEIVDTETLKNLVSIDNINKFMEEYAPGIELENIEKEGLGALINFTTDVDCNKLQNGDIVNIKITPVKELQKMNVTIETIENEFGFTLNKTTTNIAAENLTETQTVDVAAIVEDYILYSGNDGTCKPQVNFPLENLNIDFGEFKLKNYTTTVLNVVDKKDNIVGKITYKIDESFDNLKTGDQFDVILTINNDAKSFMQDKGIMPIDAIVLTVPEKNTFVDSVDKLTEEMKTEILQYHNEQIKNKGITKTSTAKYFFGTLDKSRNLGNIKNTIPTGCFAIISGAEYKGEPGVTMSVASIKLNNDGTYTIEKSNQTYEYSYAHIEATFDMNKSLDEQYTDEILKNALKTQYGNFVWEIIN